MINLENASKKYSFGGIHTYALKQINIEINHNDFIAIMGASGSGKSTLLHILGGMDRLTDGVYKYNNDIVSAFSKNKLQQFRKENISFIFQNFALMSKYSVYENVEMPLIARNIKGRRRLVEYQLERLGILNLKNKLPNEISGGQQQRCAIARAIVSNTPVILADEPTGALDSKTSMEIMKVFKSLNKDGKTIIVVTHDIGVAKECDRIIEISDGKIFSDNQKC